ncbi:hypothetical protein GCK32_000489 [Trichostrongylus colubriformis]|uniref:Uncharacterized protein n=1 Tax=Trichostrongylus colubriformis TaxID=6319 RepID=A0AAN8ETW9_TRICO
MLEKTRQTVVNVGQRTSSTISQTFWTVCYFFYFLVKGNPNWKCERYSVETLKNCCVEARKTEEAKAALQKTDASRSVLRADEPRGFSRKRIWSSLWEWTGKTRDIVVLYARRVGRFCYGIACRVVKILSATARFLWAIVRAMFWPNVKTKCLPTSTPKPFKNNAQDSPSFNKVDFDPDESLGKQELEHEQQPIPSGTSESEQGRRHGHPTPAERAQMYATEPFAQQLHATPVVMPRHTAYTADPISHHEYAPGPSTHRFTDTSLDAVQKEASPYIEENPMHASPPPPPPPPPPRPMRIDTVNGREDATVDPWEYTPHPPATTKKEPPGIGKNPEDAAGTRGIGAT